MRRQNPLTGGGWRSSSSPRQLLLWVYLSASRITMKFFRFFIAVLSLCAAAMSWNCEAYSQQVSPDKLRSRLRDASRYPELPDLFRYEIVVEMTGSGKSTTQVSGHTSLGNVVVQSVIPAVDGSPGFEVLTGINQSYTFELVRKDKQADWDIRDYTLGNPGSINLEQIGYQQPIDSTALSAMTKGVFTGIDGKGISLAKSIEENTLQLTDYEETDGELIVKYTRAGQNGSEISGSATLDRNAYLAVKTVRESDGDLSYELTSKSRFADGILQQTDSKTFYSNGLSYSSTLMSCDPPSKSIFYLSAYGFPEPAELKTSFYLWIWIPLTLMGGAMVFLASKYRARTDP